MGWAGRAGPGWAELGCVGLEWAWLRWAGLGWAGLVGFGPLKRPKARCFGGHAVSEASLFRDAFVGGTGGCGGEGVEE